MRRWRDDQPFEYSKEIENKQLEVLDRLCHYTRNSIGIAFGRNLLCGDSGVALVGLGLPSIHVDSGNPIVHEMEALKMREIIPETLGGSHDNYYNRAVEWIFSSKFRSLVRQTKPRRIMEIGVYRCEGAKMIIRETKRAGVKEIEYYGFDLFDEPPKHEYRVGWDSKGFMSVEKANELLSQLGVKHYLFKGDTKETLPRVVSNLPKMDFIYIDGGHSYETAKSDWGNCKKLMHSKTVVVFDNYDHDGVEKTVDEIGNGYNILIASTYSGTKRATVSIRRQMSD